MSIIGPNPCCGHVEWRVLPDRVPVFSREKCSACGKPLWVWYSRIEPDVLTDEEFDKEFTVDHETKEIRVRNDKVVPFRSRA